MAEPATNINPGDNQPERPGLRPIEGGGETAPDNQAVGAPKLRALEGGREGSAPGIVPDNQDDDSGHGGKFNPNGDDDFNDSGSDPQQGGGAGSGDTKKSSRGGDSGSSSTPEDSGKYNPDGDKGGRFSRAKSALSGGAGGALDKIKKNKLWAALGASAVGGALLIILLVIILLGALKIPNLAEHITTYQLNRAAREYSKSVKRVTTEKLAIDATDDASHNVLKQKYGSLRAGTWGKLDKYRPQKVIQILENEEGLKFNYKRTLLGRQRLVGVTISGTTYKVKPVTGIKSFVPGLKGYLELKNNVDFANRFLPALDTALKAQNIGRIVRGAVMQDLRKKAGISMVAWGAQGKGYGGKTASEADRLQAREAYQKIKGEIDANAKTPVIKENTEKVAQDIDETAKDDAKLDETIKKRGAITAVTDRLNTAFEMSTMDKVMSVINPVAAVGMPMCIIYDGSLTQSGGSINNQTASEKKAFYYLNAAAAQQKKGATQPEAVGAMNRKVGDAISSSAPEVRASGGTVNTNSYLSSQASPTGQTTILDVILPSGAAGVVNFMADKTCPVILSPEFAIGAFIAQVVAAVLTGGTSEAGIATAGQAAETVMGRLAQNLAGKFLTKNGAAIAGRTGDVIAGNLKQIASKKTLKSVAVVAGTTVAAKLIVLSHANANHTGLEMDNDFVAEADAGGNGAGNDYTQANYGRPLTNSEATKSDQQSLKALYGQNNGKSAFDRYANINNPYSLANKLAIAASSYIKPNFFSSFTTMSKKLFQSPTALGSSIYGLFSSPALAAASANTSNYGNVQFGWTDAEENVIDSSVTYGVLANQKILEDSGKVDDIEAKYGACFTEPIGKLVTEKGADDKYYITRDEDGNVTNDGICSPENVSFNSKDPLGLNTSPDSPNNRDLIFRWRLSHRYELTVDQLTKDMEKDSNGSGGPADTSSPDGNAQELAKKIIDKADSGKIKFNVLQSADESDNSTPEDNVKDTAKGKPAQTTSNCSGRGAQPPNKSVQLDENLLKFILELSNITEIQINALAGQCHGSPGSNHYKGKAVDFGCPLDASAANKVGNKYGISDGTGETCANSGHYHYSIGGN